MFLSVIKNLCPVLRPSIHGLLVDYGKKIAEGTPDEMKSNPDVIKAYLGDESSDA